MSRKFLQNVAGAIISIVIGLLVVPFYIRVIGAERYGVLALAWVMLGYLGIFDLGMSRSSTNSLAQVDEHDVSKMGRVFATGLAINTSLGLAGSFLIAIVGSRILLSMHALSSTVGGELHSAMPWIAFILPLTLASGISIGALDARERFLMSNILQVSSNVLGLLVPLFVATFVSPRLTAIVPALFWTRLFCTIAMLGFNVTEFGSIRVLRFDRSLAGKLLHFGGWITLTNLVGPLMTTLDQFVIGGILGVRYVAYYSVPMNAATRLQLFSTTLSRTLFPLFSRAGPIEAQYTAERALVTLSYVSMLVYAPAIAFLTPLMMLWLGKSFASSVVGIAPLLFTGAWINGLAIIPYSLVQGQGRPDLVAKIHLLEVLPYFATLWLFAHWLGIVGVALAWTARVTLDLVLLWIASGVSIPTFKRILPSAILLVAGILTNFEASKLGWQSLFGCSLVIFLTGLVLWIFLDVRAKGILISILPSRLLKNS